MNCKWIIEELIQLELTAIKTFNSIGDNSDKRRMPIVGETKMTGVSSVEEAVIGVYFPPVRTRNNLTSAWLQLWKPISYTTDFIDDWHPLSP